jgi:ATP-dependent DNA helicase RecG
VGGFLALGRFPQSVFPQLTITFVHYPTEHGANFDTGDRFLDNVTLEGPIPVMARDALAVLRRNMRRRSTVVDIGRTDTWEYPEAALREAVVNALVHRDLSSLSRGTQIQIEMYPDRLVIKNPGGLFGPVSIPELTDDGTSSARNSFLLKILEDVVLPSEDRAVCENRGSGIRTMVGSLRRAGMSLPRFEDKIASFSVTFPNHTLLDDQTIAWLKNLDEHGLSESQSVGLALLRTGERLDDSRYRAATGVVSRVATTELQDLVTRGLVAQVGSQRWAEYRLSTRFQVMDVEPAERLSPRDRRPIILDAFKSGALSRADIEAKTGLSKKVVIRWLGILRKERLVQTVGGVSVQNPSVKYERMTEV